MNVYEITIEYNTSQYSGTTDKSSKSISINLLAEDFEGATKYAKRRMEEIDQRYKYSYSEIFDIKRIVSNCVQVK